MIKSKMKIFFKINYLLSRKTIIHTFMVINENWAEVKEREWGRGGGSLFIILKG